MKNNIILYIMTTKIKICNNLPIISNYYDNLLKYILNVIHKKFTENKINYTLCSGSLLGAVRHNDRIPWDDNGDVAIFDDVKNIIVTMNFEEHGLCVKSRNCGDIKITYKTHTNKEDPHSDPYVNIHFFKKHNDIFISNYIKHETFPINDIYPLKLYQYGNLELYGVKNGYKHVIETYGKNCLFVGSFFHFHTNINKNLQQKNHLPFLGKIPVNLYLKENCLKEINYLWVTREENYDIVFEQYNKNCVVILLSTDVLNTIKEYINILLSKNDVYDITNENVRDAILEIFGGKFYDV